LELLEMLEAVECAAKDEEGPFLADQVDRRRKRARERGLPEPVDMGRDSICRQARRPPSLDSDESISARQKIVARRNWKR
jgi:hypothetical protein